MVRTTFKLCVVFSIVLPSLADINVRKYNLEQEALKLYGQDFETVLKRFRRTPDYMKILQDKLQHIKLSIDENSLQIYHHYTTVKVQEKVNEIFPTTTVAPSVRLGKNEDKKKQAVFFHSHNLLRRQMYKRSDKQTAAPEKDPEELSEDKIKKLDNYTVFTSALSVTERNRMRDLGFELAGSIIKKMYESVGVPNSDGHTEDPGELDSTTISTTEYPWQTEESTKEPESQKGSTDVTETEAHTMHTTTHTDTTTTSSKEEFMSTQSDPVELKNPAEPVDPAYPEQPLDISGSTLRASLNEVYPRFGTHTIYIDS